jgi:flavin reductase (DIM6/NTAB) family NADH-FMN oxidoreductase RutF
VDDALRADLDVDPARMDGQAAYHLLTTLVLPRPIGWVSTTDGAGHDNLAPFGYFNMCSASPPVVHITDSGGHTDTLRNIRATGEFVCNVVSWDLVEAMNHTAITFPPGTSEFEMSGVTPEKSSVVRAPRVAECHAALECRVRQYVPIGDDVMVLGDVVHVHVAGEVIVDGRVDPELLRPICRFGGNRYAEFVNLYRLPRPTWREIADDSARARLPKFRRGAWRGKASVDANGGAA